MENKIKKVAFYKKWLIGVNCMISNRAQSWLEMEYPLMSGFKKAFDYPFDLDKTPHGCINLGTAENTLMFHSLEKVSLATFYIFQF